MLDDTKLDIKFEYRDFLEKMLASQLFARQRLVNDQLVILALVDNHLLHVNEEFITDANQWIKDIEELLKL